MRIILYWLYSYSEKQDLYIVTIILIKYKESSYERY